jgi:putative spermidine/putrescine transport system ATP-binding protein
MAAMTKGFGASGAVSVRGVSKRFGDLVAVRDVSLEVEDGEFLTLLGPSGCGKTTLLRMIAGFEEPTAGTIAIGGTDITPLAPEDRPLNMVFQRYALFPHLTVFDNVAYGLRVKGRDEAAARLAVGRALEMVDMTAFAAADVTRLSGGQSQRVALARALVNEPQVLLLDEPLGALDLQLRKRMQVELRDIQHRLGTTFVFVTHDQEEALAMSRRIAVFHAGDLVQLGTPEEIYRRPVSRFVASFIGEGTLLEGAMVPGAERGLGALLLRPEHLRLVPDGQGRIAGRIHDRIFLGAYYRHLVRLPDGTEAKADGAAGLDPRPGDPVGLDWDEGAAVWVRNDE